MGIKFKALIYIICLAITLSSCGTNATKAPVNSDNVLIISEYQNGPNIHSNEILSFWIKNNTDDCITFPNDFGVKIYMVKEGKLVEVNNSMTYLPKDNIVLKAKGNIFDEDMVELHPDLSGITLNTQAQFEATISGIMCKDKSEILKKISFTIKP